MADQTSARYSPAVGDQAFGYMLTASMMLIIAGVFQAFAGLVAIFNNDFYPATREYLFQFDVTTWGWIHLLMGALVALAGLAILGERTWGPVVGIILAALSAIANFAFIPHYPLWALMIVALDVLAIWTLAAHSREIRDALG